MRIGFRITGETPAAGSPGVAALERANDAKGAADGAATRVNGCSWLVASGAALTMVTALVVEETVLFTRAVLACVAVPVEEPAAIRPCTTTFATGVPRPVTRS